MEKVYKRTPFYYNNPTLYHSKRVDNDDRWEFIEQHLRSNHESLLDIGCAEGFFTARAAQHNLRTTAFEVNKKRVNATRERIPDNSEATVEQREINPETIDQLPEMDVTLLLTVHHHWDKVFGREQAMEMLETVAAKTDLLVYEPPGNRLLKGQQIDQSDSIEIYSEIINAVFGDQITIVDVEMFDYMSHDPNTRSDPVFIINTESVTA